ncbi:hypothetical protein ACWCQ0_45405 [Streptomyces massasporeus]
MTSQATTVTRVPNSAHLAILTGAGVPAPFAEILVDVDRAVEHGALARQTGDLTRLIGRPTTPIAVTIEEALAGS